MPDKLAPMLAGTGKPFDSSAYLFEVKWDGIRVLASFGPGGVRLLGRKRTDATARYPELVIAFGKLPGSGVLDGEVVVLDDDGRPNFQRVLVREQTASREQALRKSRDHPVAYMAFDLLELNGESLVARPLSERKQMLAELLSDPPSPLVLTTFVVGRGKALYEEAKARGLEGVVAKRLDSRYLPGERSDAWLKLKVRRRTNGVLVGLVRESRGGRVKSLVLGAYRGSELVWIGNVGSGLDQETVAALGRELGPLAAAAPPGFMAEAPGVIDWLRPALVVRVEYSELTMEGRLRHPVFVGFVHEDPSGIAPPERIGLTPESPGTP